MESLAFYSIQNHIVFCYKLQSYKNRIVGLDPANVYKAHRKRLSWIINMPYDPDRSLSYCIRTVTHLFNLKIVGGEIASFFLVKMSDQDSTKGQDVALLIKMLLAGNVENILWEEIVSVEELAKAVNHIDMQSRHHYKIRRSSLNIASITGPLFWMTELMDVMMVRKMTFLKP